MLIVSGFSEGEGEMRQPASGSRVWWKYLLHLDGVWGNTFLNTYLKSRLRFSRRLKCRQHGRKEENQNELSGAFKD
jgi:hypothetical protein